MHNAALTACMMLSDSTDSCPLAVKQTHALWDFGQKQYDIQQTAGFGGQSGGVVSDHVKFTTSSCTRLQ